MILEATHFLTESWWCGGRVGELQYLFHCFIWIIMIMFTIWRYASCFIWIKFFFHCFIWNSVICISTSWQSQWSPDLDLGIPKKLDFSSQKPGEFWIPGESAGFQDHSWDCDGCLSVGEALGKGWINDPGLVVVMVATRYLKYTPVI